MEPETRREYNEMNAHKTEFGRDADVEPPSRTECRTQVCVCTCAHVYVLGRWWLCFRLRHNQSIETIHNSEIYSTPNYNSNPPLDYVTC